MERVSPVAAASSALAYRPEIDGLRAIAVVVVLLFHARLGCAGGFVGVDVFFVISGFLITSLIRRAVDNQTFSLVEFWERRIRRIAPAMLVMIGVVLAAGVCVMLPADLTDTAKSARAHLLLISNFYFWLQVDYFAPQADSQPLLHTWSLAVEEQFYLLFPIVFPFLWMRSKRLAKWALAMAFGASLALGVWGTSRSPVASFFLPPTRAWELLIGALLAIDWLPAVRARWLREVLSWAGLIAVGYAVATFDALTPFPGSAALWPCLGTAAIIHANTPGRTSLGYLLSWRPIVGIGLISYSLYLWHWPVLVFTGYVWPEIWQDPIARSLLVASCIPISWLSWKFVESPWRGRKLLPSRPTLFGIALACVWLGAVAASLIFWLEGLPKRFSHDVGADDRLSEERKFFAVHVAEDVRNDNVNRLGASRNAKLSAEFLVWGDSHAGAISPALDQMGLTHQKAGACIGYGSTPPLVGAWNRGTAEVGKELGPAVLDFVERHQTKHVVLVARWSVYTVGFSAAERIHRNQLTNLLVDNDDETPTLASAQQTLQTSLRRTVDALRERGANVWIVREVPFQNYEVRRTHHIKSRLGLTLAEFGTDRETHRKNNEATNAILDSVRGDGVHILDPADWLFDEQGRGLLMANGRLLYRDDDHISADGARHLAAMFAPLFENKGRQ